MDNYKVGRFFETQSTSAWSHAAVTLVWLLAYGGYTLHASCVPRYCIDNTCRG